MSSTAQRTCSGTPGPKPATFRVGEATINELSAAAERYTLTARKIDDSAVLLNGRPLQLDSPGELPPLRGVTVTAGNVELAPASITFLAVPEARNGDCQ